MFNVFNNSAWWGFGLTIFILTVLFLCGAWIFHLAGSMAFVFKMILTLGISAFISVVIWTVIAAFLYVAHREYEEEE